MMPKFGWMTRPGQSLATWWAALVVAMVFGSGCGNPNEPAIEGKVGAGDEAPASMEDFYQQQQQQEQQP